MAKQISGIPADFEQESGYLGQFQAKKHGKNQSAAGKRGYAGSRSAVDTLRSIFEKSVSRIKSRKRHDRISIKRNSEYEKGARVHEKHSCSGELLSKMR